MVEKIAGIYRIQHRDSDAQYVGSSANIIDRFRRHRALLNRSTHHCAHLQSAWLKYGQDAFEFQIIEIVSVETRSHLKPFLFEREQFWFRAVAGRTYNAAPIAGSSLGVVHSAKTREKVSQANRGRFVSAATREKMRRAKLGKPRSSATRSKIGASSKGRVISAETKKRMAEWQRGKVLSSAHRAKLSAAVKATLGRKKALAA